VALAAAGDPVAVARPAKEPWFAAWLSLEPGPVEWEGMP
jgi:hypothetical protein